MSDLFHELLTDSVMEKFLREVWETASPEKKQHIADLVLQEIERRIPDMFIVQNVARHRVESMATEMVTTAMTPERMETMRQQVEHAIIQRLKGVGDKVDMVVNAVMRKAAVAIEGEFRKL